jgi:dihydroflavonol-4-reductase
MSTQDKVLVTGASGFIGSAVAYKLVEAGFSVRALVRSTSPRAHLADLSLEFFEGDVRDRKSLDCAVAGMRYVFHTAADYRLWARDPGEIFATNVEGTRNLMEAAMDAAESGGKIQVSRGTKPTQRVFDSLDIGPGIV